MITFFIAVRIRGCKCRILDQAGSARNSLPSAYKMYRNGLAPVSISLGVDIPWENVGMLGLQISVRHFPGGIVRFVIQEIPIILTFGQNTCRIAANDCILLTRYSLCDEGIGLNGNMRGEVDAFEDNGSLPNPASVSQDNRSERNVFFSRCNIL